MIEFVCDYAEGAHERILQKLVETNYVQTPGYGEDKFCQEARDLIRKHCKAPKADVHFLEGGTQTNLTVISSALRPHQGVVAAECGHIAVHETGAIEATGHKVLPVESADGKIKPEQIRQLYYSHIQDVNHEHLVQPKMVYISNPTEYGLLYSLNELQAVFDACRECGYYLYMDGARMGYGLASSVNSLALADIARLCDVFYIGGTKCGAMFGEAVVITNDVLKEDFRYMIKQKGGMLAKGRMLGIQFLELFRDNLYFDICAHGNRLSARMKQGFLEKGWELYVDSNTNQQFPIIPNDILKKIGEKYSYCIFEKREDNTTVARFCTSWATKECQVDEFLEDLKQW